MIDIRDLTNFIMYTFQRTNIKECYDITSSISLYSRPNDLYELCHLRRNKPAIVPVGLRHKDLEEHHFCTVRFDVDRLAQQ